MHTLPDQQTSASFTSEQELLSRTPAAPLFILGVPRSYTSVVCAMLGQHPQMYGLPEMHLFTVDTVAQWWQRSERARPTMPDGALRVIAEIIYGAQTEFTATLAEGWLRRRSHYTTAFLLEVLAAKVSPRTVVCKNPNLPARLHRAYRMFSNARFLHLVRHPRGQGNSVLNLIDRLSKTDYPPKWLLDIASNNRVPMRTYKNWRHLIHFDPQLSWYERNMNICQFLENVPVEQQMRVRGEDILLDPDWHLAAIAVWMGMRSDKAAVEEMKHPERSPFARFGPKGARAGGDPAFLASPLLRPSRAEKQRLEGPLSWNADGRGFLPPVKQLARQFGYE